MPLMNGQTPTSMDDSESKMQMLSSLSGLRHHSQISCYDSFVLDVETSTRCRRDDREISDSASCVHQLQLCSGVVHRLPSPVISNHHQSSAAALFGCGPPPARSSYHQLSSVVISRSQPASAVISGHQWSSVIISGHQSSSAIKRYHNSSSPVISNHHHQLSVRIDGDYDRPAKRKTYS